jgi:(p)ppGpp synthase/HD superfamily hydrolase
MDRMQWKGMDLEMLLAKHSRFRRDWLSFVQTARIAIHNQTENEAEM